jgi:hypothetical protein
MCQVNSFNLDHEKCIQGCNCCKSKDSAASVSATLAERERIIKLLENQHNFDQIFLDAVDKVIALIKGESND